MFITIFGISMNKKDDPEIFGNVFVEYKVFINKRCAPEIFWIVQCAEIMENIKNNVRMHHIHRIILTLDLIGMKRKYVFYDD